MELLQKTILAHGKVLPNNVLKVGSFLNQQIDAGLLKAMAQDIYEKFSDCGVNKILTVEASGIALACVTAQFFNCKTVFAKKSKTSNLDGENLTAECFSYTHQKLNHLIIPKAYLNENDKVLIVDDFLAHGEAIRACCQLVESAGAEVVGAAIAIEKGFQGGGDKFRKDGLNVYSLAIIDEMDENGIKFRKE